MENDLLKLLTQNKNIGYAECELIFDAENKVSDCRVVQANETLKNMGFLKDRELVGKSMFEFMPGFNAEHLSQLVRIRDEKSIFSFPMGMVPLTCRLDVSIIFFSETKFAGIVTEDIKSVLQAQKELKSVNDNIIRVLENIQIAVSILRENNGHFIYEYINNAHEKIFGFAKESLIDKTSSEVYDKKIGKKLLSLQKKAYKTGESVRSMMEVECNSRHVSGEGIIIPYESEGMRIGVLEMFFDVTDLRKTQQELEIALKGMNLDVFRYDVQRRVFSFKFPKIFTEGEIEFSDYLYRYIHRSDQDNLYRCFEDYIHGKKEELCCEYRIKIDENSYQWVKTSGCAVACEKGIPVEIVGVNQDITESKTITNRLKVMLNYDTLTGLVNKKRITEIMQKAFEQNGKQLCAAGMFLDMDNFKNINDLLGHEAGDDFLKATAKAIASNIPYGSVAARLSGDEFFIFIPRCRGKEEVEETAKNVIRSVALLATDENDHIEVSASAGICLYPENAKTVEAMFSCSDIAMFQAKKQGKNQYAFYNERETQEHVKSFRLAHDLGIALEKDEFEMVYQPIYCTEQKKFLGLEGLLRWNHPLYGQFLPEAFIQSAEISGSIVAIEYKMIKNVFAQISVWNQAGVSHGEISLNLSSVSLNRVYFASSIIHLLSIYHLSAEKIGFEIAMESFLCQTDTMRKNVDELKKAGFKIIVDHFDCRLSALYMLENMDFDIIKIDRNLTAKSENKEVSRYVFSLIANLLKRKEKLCIVQGVEHKEQMDFFEKIGGFTLFQGYYFSHPKDVAGIITMLAEESS